MNKIESLKVVTRIDEDPDFSHMGKYTDNPGEWSICRHCGKYVHDAETGNRAIEAIHDQICYLETKQPPDPSVCAGCNQQEYDRYEKLIDALNVALSKFDEHGCPMSSDVYNFFTPEAGGEAEGSKDYQKYGRQDFERMESYNRQQWYYTGIMVEATVSTPKVDRCCRLEEFVSGGLWGVESDSGDYLNDVLAEEIADLKQHLGHFNIDLSNFDELAKDLEIDL